jgi:hypothetical protein
MIANNPLRKILIVFGICFLPVFIQAQVKNFPLIDFKTKEDFKKSEPQILEMADYVLSRPSSDSDENKNTYANIIKWMSGTPDFQFTMDNSIMELSKNNEAILPLYMVCATKAALDSPLPMDDKKIKLRSFEILLDYCSEKSNGIKHNKEMKKAIEAKANGSLEKYLHI